MRKPFSIAIDGPAGAGKSTVAREVARRLGAVYLDTGAMYRTVGLYMARNGIEAPDAIARALPGAQVEVRFEDGRQIMALCGEDVTEAIRTPEASMGASLVGAVPEVRRELVRLQRDFARGHSVVMDGRDIATDVLPDATVKVFLTASARERARRRWEELKAKGEDRPFDEVLDEIERRDYNDAHRDASPMRRAPDAVEVDTSEMTVEASVEAILALARSAGIEA